VSNHDHAYEDAVAVATGSTSKGAVLKQQLQDEEDTAAASAGKRKPSDDAATGTGKRAKGEE